MVVGHVDGIGTLLERHEDARSTRMRFELPEALARYVARKGSVCINGASLTVNDVEPNRFGVNIIPHTLAQTLPNGRAHVCTPVTNAHLVCRLLLAHKKQ